MKLGGLFMSTAMSFLAVNTDSQRERGKRKSHRSKKSKAKNKAQKRARRVNR